MSVDPPSLRVMTWNIRGGVGADGHCDLGRVAAFIARHKPDIVAIQEVDSRRPVNLSEGPFAFLAAACGGHAADCRPLVAPDGEYGHLLASRWPLSGMVEHDISLKGREPRAAIEAVVETPHGPLHVVAAHLGLSFTERRHQAEKLAAIARQGEGPGIVLGDFNDWISPGTVQKALEPAYPARSRHRTFPAFWPFLDLDRIYCRTPARLLRSRTDRMAHEASDHLPVIADIALGP